VIADVLVFLKNRLNAHFLASLGAGLTDAGEDKVVFIDGDQKPEATSFKLGAVSLLLFNIERDVVGRQADSYVRVANDGSSRQVSPEITINLHIMFVAKFKDYEQGLHYLSLVLSYFQEHFYFDQQNSPELSQSINHLLLEFNPPTAIQEQELWGMLHCAYLPSLLYKVKALTFANAGEPPSKSVSAVILKQEQL
jgi:hypothetical protein